MAYTTADDVLSQTLKGFTLTALGDVAEQEDFLDNLILATDSILENEAGRDFLLHADDDVTLSGNNADQIAVWKDDHTLCAPIIAVNSLAVYDNVLDVTELKIDASAGIIGYQATSHLLRNAIPRVRNRQYFAVFPKDFRNVTVNLDWGYATVPSAIKRAAQYLAGAAALVTVSGAISRGVRLRKIADFEVAYNRDGPYAQHIQRWLDLTTLLLNQYRTGRKP